MSFRVSVLAVFVSILFCLSCSKESRLPAQLEIRTQEDLDQYCSELQETTIYEGSITFLEDTEGLDLSCFENIREVTKFLSIDSKEAAEAFRNIEKVGGEGLAISGSISEPLVFDNLIEVTSISIFSWSDLNEIHFPNVEKLDFFQMGSIANVEKLSGFNKVKSMQSLRIASLGDTIGEINFFHNLEDVSDLTIDLPKETKLTPESFENLKSIKFLGDIYKNNLGYNLQNLFPSLSSCPDLRVHNNETELEDFCYLKTYLGNDSINVSFSKVKDFVSENYTNEDILSACQ